MLDITADRLAGTVANKTLASADRFVDMKERTVKLLNAKLNELSFNAQEYVNYIQHKLKNP